MSVPFAGWIEIAKQSFDRYLSKEFKQDMIDKRTEGSCFVRESSFLQNYPVVIPFMAAGAILRWLRMHYMPLLYRLDQHPISPSWSHAYITPEPSIRTLCKVPGHFQPIPCQFSSLSIKHYYSNPDLSCGPRILRVVSLQLTCFHYFLL